ncbi:MAG: MOSC domain-containing protein [Victivallales bacterium]|nr:MOSC domain-containing protein [Victivallales bacterium]
MEKYTGKVYSVNISGKRGSVKSPVGAGEIGEKGVLGDAHYGHSLKHVSIISKERIDEFSKKAGIKIYPGEFAENITTCGLNLSKAGIGSRFKVGDAQLEVIQIGKDEEVDSNKIFRIIGKAVMVHEGLFCKVLNPGKVFAGDQIELHLP